MQRLLILIWLLLTAACTHNELDNHYSCSYETTEEEYQRCMEVSEGLDRETREAAVD